nr:signal peptidase II [Govania unica]
MLAAGLIVLADQLSKWWVLDIFQLPAKGIVEVLPFFNLVMVWNRGVSFGLLAADGDLGRWLLVGFTLAICGVVAVWLKRAERCLVAAALALVLGGAIGNIIDRVRLGAVADFIQLHAAGYSFYVFNIADAAISIGVALLLMDAILSGRQNGSAEG